MSKPPPSKVRITKLQELQLDAAVAIDLECKSWLHRAGVSAADDPARGLPGFGKLLRSHNVLAADADGVTAGYIAWRDESPGVAYLEEIAVKPDLQRLGIGTKLLDAVKEEARGRGLPVLITRCWTKAASGTAFLKKAGLVPLASSEERAGFWKQEQEAAGPFVKEGQAALMFSLGK